MIRCVTFLALIVALCGAEGRAQQAAAFKHFSSFKGLVDGVDFYASKRQSVTPYEKPVSETISRLQTLLGPNLPKGAIFICSTLQQKDSVYEPMVLKAGYGWTLTIITPDVRMQEMLDRVKSQMGGEIPAEIKSRMGNMQQMTAEYEGRMVNSTNQQIAHAVLWSLLDKDSQFRSNRLDDMTKSPLPDWLDIGIASYASGVDVDLSFLQQHMDETFPLDDVLAMSRPFVASTFGSNQGSSGSFRGRGGMSGGMPGGMSGGMPSGMSGGMSGGMPGGMFGGGDMPRFGGGSGGMGGFGSRGSGGSGGRSRNGGNSQRVLPKDEQDQMLFDAQSGTFFSYMLEKAGIEKMKELVQQAIEGHETREFVIRPDVLGSNMDQIEKDWASWVQALSPQKS